MKLVILEPLAMPRDDLEIFAKTLKGVQIKSFDSKPKDIEETIDRVSTAEIVMLVNSPFPKEVIEKCTKLKMISIAFTGYDHVDVEYCKKRGIAVTNAAGYATDSVAELSLGMVLALYRSLIKADLALRKGRDRTGLLGTELKGKTWGIVGTGAIGARVAQIASVFGCKLLGFNRSKKENCKKLGLKYVTLETLLAQSDIVSVHLPLNAGTKNIISQKELSMMKSSAILINVARGGIVNEADLSVALNKGLIAAAGVDVFEIEPPIPQDHPLFSAKNIVLTPHVAFATKEALMNRAQIAFANTRAWLEGRKLNRVD